MKDNRYQVYEDFQKMFPIETLAGLPLEKYTNLKKSDSFCYWVESKTYCLGSIWGGTSYKFGIYEYNKKPNNPTVITEDEQYAWYNKYNATSRDAAYEIVLDSIIRVAEAARNGNFKEIDKEDYAISGVYKWKVAFLYANFGLIPIFKKEMLVDIAESFGLVDSKSKSVSELQAFVMKQKGEKDFFEYYDYLLTLTKQSDNNSDEGIESVDGPRYWIYAPGEDAVMWEEFYQTGTMGLGWGKIGDYRQYPDDNSLVNAIEQHYGG